MKPYTFEEIRDFLDSKLKKTKNILTFGFIGSCNVEHDLDIIITKRSFSQTADFYKEIHGIFDELNAYLNKKYKSKLLCYPAGKGGELSTFVKVNKFDLIFEVMIYTTYDQIRRDWEWALYEDESLTDLLINQKFLLGSFSDIQSHSFAKKNYHDPTYIRLYLNLDRFNAGYSKQIFLEIMRKWFDYLYRKRLGLKTPNLKNEKDIRKYFYELCDILDKLVE